MHRLSQRIHHGSLFVNDFVLMVLHTLLERAHLAEASTDNERYVR